MGRDGHGQHCRDAGQLVVFHSKLRVFRAASIGVDKYHSWQITDRGHNLSVHSKVNHRFQLTNLFMTDKLYAFMQELGEDTIAEVLGSLQYATEAAPGWAKAWHNWALFNVQVRHSRPPALTTSRPCHSISNHRFALLHCCSLATLHCCSLAALQSGCPAIYIVGALSCRTAHARLCNTSLVLVCLTSGDSSLYGSLTDQPQPYLTPSNPKILNPGRCYDAAGFHVVMSPCRHASLHWQAWSWECAADCNVSAYMPLSEISHVWLTLPGASTYNSPAVSTIFCGQSLLVLLQALKLTH